MWHVQCSPSSTQAGALILWQTPFPFIRVQDANKKILLWHKDLPPTHPSRRAERFLLLYSLNLRALTHRPVSWLQSTFFCFTLFAREEAAVVVSAEKLLRLGASSSSLTVTIFIRKSSYQLMRDVRPRVIKYTWLAPPGRTEAKKTWKRKRCERLELQLYLYCRFAC